MSDTKSKFLQHDDLLTPIIQELHEVLIEVINKNKGMADLQIVLNKLSAARQLINDQDNIGFVLGFDWQIIPFALSGIPELDVDQTNHQIPPDKLN